MERHDSLHSRSGDPHDSLQTRCQDPHDSLQKSSLDPVALSLTRRRYAAIDVITALSKLTEPPDPEQTFVLRHVIARLSACNEPENTWISPSARTRENKIYTASGRFWSCNSKLCPHCVTISARKNRKRLRDALAYYYQTEKSKSYFYTFTIPNIGLSLPECRSIVNYAWSLFRKRSYVVSLLRGGCKSEEFTVTRKGVHYHLHGLMLADRWLHYDTIRSLWTDCVAASFAQHHREFVVENSDGKLWCVIKKLKSPDVAIKEICKYITKSDSWRRLDQSLLLEIALYERWHRMFELFGDLRSYGPAKRIVHTKGLFDERKRGHNSELEYIRRENDADALKRFYKVRMQNCVAFSYDRLRWCLNTDQILTWPEYVQLFNSS